MTSYKQSSFGLPLREKTIRSDSDSRIEAKSSTKPCNMIALQHQDISNMDISHGVCFHDSAMPAKVLHESKDNMPAITLTTYKDDALTRQVLAHIHLEGVPEHGENIAKSLEEAVTNGSLQLDHQDENLVRDLDIHFQVLKSEFEERTGRAWTPLRAWEKEDGDWDLGGEEGEDGDWVKMDVIEG